VRLPSELLREELEGGVGEGALGGTGDVEGGASAAAAGAGEGGAARGAGETARTGAGDGARAGREEGERAEEGVAAVGVVGELRSSGLASTSSTCSCRTSIVQSRQLCDTITATHLLRILAILLDIQLELRRLDWHGGHAAHCHHSKYGLADCACR
jgi:hypothetical protein